jgi:hypothetical protein
MFRVGFEHTITVFKRAKAVHAFDRAATVIGILAATPFTKYFQFQRHRNSSLFFSELRLEIEINEMAATTTAFLSHPLPSTIYRAY